MKQLIFIILIFLSFSSFSQNVWKTEWLKQDKAMHLTVSCFLTALGTETAKDWNVKNPEVVGITFSLSVGLYKEFFYDEKPSVYDLTADIVGAIAGVYLNRLFNRWEYDHFYRYKST